MEQSGCGHDAVNYRENMEPITYGSLQRAMIAARAKRREWRASAGIPYDRDADMRACVRRHGGLRIVRWERGKWRDVYAPWRKVKAVEYSTHWPRGRATRR